MKEKLHYKLHLIDSTDLSRSSPFFFKLFWFVIVDWIEVCQILSDHMQGEWWED